MRFFNMLAVFTVVLMTISTAAQAAHWTEWIFPPPVDDHERVYMHDGKTRHMHTRDDDPWTPQVWNENGVNAQEVMDGFYRAGIITDQDTEDDVPVLEVGQGFMQLSSREKRRVAEFIDSVYKFTESSELGMFKLRHWEKCDPVGIYTRYGLQLQ